MQMYQSFKRIPFRILGGGVLSRQIVAPLVTEFQKRLNDFKFEEGSFSAWVEVADDLQINFTEPTVADGSFRISLEMRDKKYEESASRFNQFEISVLNTLLKELEFQMGHLALKVKN